VTECMAKYQSHCCHMESRSSMQSEPEGGGGSNLTATCNMLCRIPLLLFCIIWEGGEGGLEGGGRRKEQAVCNTFTVHDQG
jgi:hypothetical protein